jgi:hypothetical protein
MPRDQVIARIRILASRLYSAAAAAILETMERRGFRPYGDLAKVPPLFSTIAHRLRALGEKAFISLKKKKEAEEVPAAGRPEIQGAARALLEAARTCMPLLHEGLAGLISVYYPETVKVKKAPR